MDDVAVGACVEVSVPEALSDRLCVPEVDAEPLCEADADCVCVADCACVGELDGDDDEDCVALRAWEVDCVTVRSCEGVREELRDWDIDGVVLRETVADCVTLRAWDADCVTVFVEDRVGSMLLVCEGLCVTELVRDGVGELLRDCELVCVSLGVSVIVGVPLPVPDAVHEPLWVLEPDCEALALGESDADCDGDAD